MKTGYELLCGRAAVTKGGIRVEIAKATQCMIFGKRDSLAGMISDGYAQIGLIKAAP